MVGAEPGVVVAVSLNPSHAIGKPSREAITLLAGLGVEGDTHAGVTDQHRSHVKRYPSRPNLRQVHLIHAELHEELAASGFTVGAGEMGENVTTRGIDLLGLPRGALLCLGNEAVIEVTGLRNPCWQLNGIWPGLMEATLSRDTEGNLIRKAGVMAVVRRGGVVRAGDSIAVELPPLPYLRLEPV